MLTRVSRPRLGEPPEVCSVADSAKDRRQSASPALPSRTHASRHAGSGTKRGARDGRSATFPRRAFGTATPEPSRSEAHANGQSAGGHARVFVLDRHGECLMPCHPVRARELLDNGRARVHRLIPFAIRLVDRIGGSVHPIRLKLDPGSKITGIALVRETDTTTGEIQHKAVVLHLIELRHRGASIRDRLTQRRGFRRRRRSANLRHRAPRFDNRTRPKGWLAPSVQHRVDSTAAWVGRLRQLCPVSALSQELVRFDLQKTENPEINGVEYQQGALAGYEIREYLLEKWHRRCVYCDAEQVPLQIEHVVCKARGGSDRVSNLTLACGPCNTLKGTLAVEGFLAKDTNRLDRITAQLKAPLHDATAVNATRWTLWRQLIETSLPVETGSGGRTKFNRTQFGIPKTHALDATCVGVVDSVTNWQMPVLAIKATGRGSRKRTRLDQYGFPRGYLMRGKTVRGFRTGDLVRAVVPSGKKAGTHTGRVAVRASGSFNIQMPAGTVQGISHTHCRLLMRGDGYGYAIHALLPAVNGEVSALGGM